MKKLFDILTDDKKSFEINGVWFMVALPVVVIVLMGIAGYVDRL